MRFLEKFLYSLLLPEGLFEIWQFQSQKEGNFKEKGRLLNAKGIKIPTLMPKVFGLRDVPPGAAPPPLARVRAPGPVAEITGCVRQLDHRL